MFAKAGVEPTKKTGSKCLPEVEGLRGLICGVVRSRWTGLSDRLCRVREALVEVILMTCGVKEDSTQSPPSPHLSSLHLIRADV